MTKADERDRQRKKFGHAKLEGAWLKKTGTDAKQALQEAQDTGHAKAMAELTEEFLV